MRVVQYEGGIPVHVWDDSVTIESEAFKQVENMSKLPIVEHIALMPDAHWGNGACVGSVIGTSHAVIPAAVGVDIGCGMIAVKTTLRAEHLPDSLSRMRSLIEEAVPHGRTSNGGRGDRGAWGDIPEDVKKSWEPLDSGFKSVVEKNPKIGTGNTINHLGTLGTGNHFIEVCLDADGFVWITLHSGSRGVGNRIGSFFIERAKERMRERIGDLPDVNLAWLEEGSPDFDNYCEAVEWAQEFARHNRQAMMDRVIAAIRKSGVSGFEVTELAVNCHHNYISRERHGDKNLWVTRKGAVCASKGTLGFIPGSMGAKSYVVRGLGGENSLNSCSHGAGRSMSRTAAKKAFTLEDHIKATEGVECRKDEDVIDETPAAYKNIDAVMESQRDLVEVVATLKQVLCVKG